MTDFAENQPLGGGDPQGIYYADLAQLGTYFHLAGVDLVAGDDQGPIERLVATSAGTPIDTSCADRANARRGAILDQLRVELLIAQTAGDARRCAAVQACLDVWPTATYARDGDSWRLDIPGYPSQWSRPTRAWDEGEAT